MKRLIIFLILTLSIKNSWADYKEQLVAKCAYRTSNEPGFDILPKDVFYYVLKNSQGELFVVSGIAQEIDCLNKRTQTLRGEHPLLKIYDKNPAKLSSYSPLTEHKSNYWVQPKVSEGESATLVYI